MLKREREESMEIEPGQANGVKIQKVAQTSDRLSEDPRRTISQEPSNGFPGKKGQRQRSSSARPDDLRTEVYKEGRKLKPPRLLEEGETYKMLVRVPVDSMQHHNRQVKARTLWGSDIYTHDSDVVAVLMHCGYINSITGVPRNTVSEALVIVEYAASAKFYPSVYRNGIRSRAWGFHENGYAYRILRCTLISRQGTEIEVQACLDGEGSVAPTFTPAHYERAIATRATASNIERRQRALHEVTVQFNMCNEPWLKYSMQGIADRGLKPAQLTSARFYKEVLFLETYSKRYEISLERKSSGTEQQESAQAESFRFGRCKVAFPLVKMKRIGLPLPLAELEMIATSLPWEAIQFSAAGVTILGKTYPLFRFHFTRCTSW